MESQATNQMRLYNRRSERLYLNDSEVCRFINVACRAPSTQRLFALTLVYTGMRLSEARMLQKSHIQLSQRVVSVRTLKKRNQHVVREIPLPRQLAAELQCRSMDDSDLLFTQQNRVFDRITTYRWIKRMMAQADIQGAKACPKGLRHAFGVRAILSGVPLHMVQRWMGHASMRTTAIYTTVLGQEQLNLSDQMW